MCHSPVEVPVVGGARRVCGGVPSGEDPGAGVSAGEEALRAATVRTAEMRHPAGGPHLRGFSARLLHRARVCQGREVRALLTVPTSMLTPCSCIPL